MLTHEELNCMTERELLKLLPREVRPFFPGRDIAKQMGWTFYVMDGEAWDMVHGKYVQV